jgi:Resolvase, N terminal domain
LSERPGEERIYRYKVDRLTRSLADFAKLVELFDEHGVLRIDHPVLQYPSSMGRLTLNVLLSFAQFEREVIGERVRDKIAASKRKGLWVGGPYTRDLFQTPGISETVNLGHAKRHYYESHRTINPTGIVPLGPILDFVAPHDRANLGRASAAA